MFLGPARTSDSTQHAAIWMTTPTWHFSESPMHLHQEAEVHVDRLLLESPIRVARTTQHPWNLHCTTTANTRTPLCYSLDQPKIAKAKEAAVPHDTNYCVGLWNQWCSHWAIKYIRDTIPSLNSISSVDFYSPHELCIGDTKEWWLRVSSWKPSSSVSGL